MSLATRCSECGTVFRVVPDQLKVSDGWVRCGRCSAVFNAQASLFDLDESATAASAAPAQLHWGDQPASSSSDLSSGRTFDRSGTLQKAPGWCQAPVDLYESGTL